MSIFNKTTPSYILYQEARSALKLLKPSPNELGQLYALECIIEGRSIKLHLFPLSNFKNTKVEISAYDHMQTSSYTSLTKEQAEKDYVQYVKLLLKQNQMHIKHANNILNDDIIGTLPMVKKI